MAEGAPREKPASSSKKVLNLLLQFSAERTELSVAEMAELTGGTLPSTYRYLALLKDMELVEEGRPGRYHPTARVVPLARAAQLSNPLSQVALPILQKASAAIGETVMLQQLVGESLICVELAECDRPMRFTIPRGRTTPLGLGASGKMALAMLRGVTRETLAEHVPQTKLDEYLAQGFATSYSEIDAGVWACSVPAISTRKVIAVLSSAGPESRISDEAKAATVATLQDNARQINEAYSRLTL